MSLWAKGISSYSFQVRIHISWKQRNKGRIPPMVMEKNKKAIFEQYNRYYLFLGMKKSVCLGINKTDLHLKKKRV